MTDITVEFFTDPLSPWCWQCEPITRKLRFRFGNNIEWVPRMTVLLADPDDGEGVLPGFDDPDEGPHEWPREVEGPSLPVVEALWEENPPKSSRAACQVVASARERHPAKAELLLRHLRESAFVVGKPPDDHTDIEALVRQNDLDIKLTVDNRALLTDIARACAVASELEDGVATQGPIETVEVGERLDGEVDDTTAMVRPPCVRLELDGHVVVVSPRVGYESLENAIRTVEPSLQSSRVGHMEQLIDSIASRTTREIAEQFGGDNLKSKTKDYLKQFQRAFLAEIVFGVDASRAKTSRILFQLEEASIIEPIYGEELAAWSWKDPSG